MDKRYSAGSVEVITGTLCERYYDLPVGGQVTVEIQETGTLKISTCSETYYTSNLQKAFCVENKNTLTYHFHTRNSRIVLEVNEKDENKQLHKELVALAIKTIAPEYVWQEA